MRASGPAADGMAALPPTPRRPGGLAGRFTPIRWPAEIVLALAVLALVGVAVVDDYGVGWDTDTQRRIARMNAEFAFGEGPLPPGVDRFYGVAFELSLEAVNRALGLRAERGVYLSRHLLSHLFFLAGALACSLLTYRLCGDRRIALVALLLFVLAPRLYAPSFYSSKDAPFLSMFMIALCSAHWAFRRGGVTASLGAGVGAGLLLNLRLTGVVLLLAVLVCHAVDVANSPGRRRRALAAAAAFLTAAACTLYATSPWLWADPTALADGWRTMTRFPRAYGELFEGRIVKSNALPAHFAAKWFGISTPPATLLLGAVGAAAVLARGLRRPAQLVANTPLRFEAMLLACVAFPLVASLVLESPVRMRHLFFLHGPAAVLAALGLRWLVTACGVRLGGAALALAGGGLVATAAEMAQIHPHQQIYFNYLVDRATPERLGNTYELDHRANAVRQGLEDLLAHHPGRTLRVYNRHPARMNWRILPPAERARLVLTCADAEFRIVSSRGLRALAAQRVVLARKLYGSTILAIVEMSPNQGPMPKEPCSTA